jgi:hypothetical protein
VFLGDRLRHIDREKFGFTLGSRRRGNGVDGDLAVQRAHGHERIEGRIAGHLGDLIGAELGDRHLFGIDARFGQDHAQQRHIRLGSTDDADVMSHEIVETLDFRRWRFF